MFKVIFCLVYKNPVQRFSVKWRKRQIPYSKGHYEETRAKIIHSARRLFNRFGFDSVSIDRIMSDANLTRGAFYRYFDSKSDLYAEVLECFFTDPGWDNSWKGVHIDLTAADIGPQIVRAYLSRQHLAQAWWVGKKPPIQDATV